MGKQGIRFLAVAAVFAAFAVLTVLSGCGGDPLAGLVTYQLTVRSDGHGTTDPSGTQAVNKGDAKSIKATPNSGYAFSSWTAASGSGVTFANPNAAATTVTLSAGDATVQANFTANSYVLTVASGGNGSVSPTGNVAVDHGAATTISATPSTGYSFLNWTVTSGTGVTFGNANTASTTVTLTGGNATVQANFAQDVVTLTVNNDGNGTTNPTGNANAASGAATSITATPNTGYHFVNWTVVGGTATIASTTSASTTVTLTGGNATIKANFAINTYMLTVASGGNGAVTPTSAQTVNHGAATAITATPASGYGFLNWTVTTGTATFGNAYSATTTVSLTSGDASIQANFAQGLVALTVTNDGGGSTYPSGGAAAALGVPVSINAYPNAGYQFVNWTLVSGSATFTNPSSATGASVTLTSDATIRANFQLKTYSLTMTVNNTIYGSVSPSGTVTVSHGVATPITATPNPGYHFTGWSYTSGSGVTFDDAGATPTTVKLESGSATVRATFAPDEYTLTVNADAHGTITTPAVSPATALHGASTAIVASVATAGYHFVNWTYSGSGVAIADANSASTTVTLTGGNATVTAHFAINTYQLTVTTDGHGTITAPASSPTTVDYGALTTITASSTTGYHFTNWSNPTGSATIANSAINSTTVILTSGDATVQANFEKIQCTLTVIMTGGGDSTVTINPASGPHYYGDEITLTPSPATGYTFKEWTGDTSGIAGSGPSYTLTITANTTVTAVFVSGEINVKVVLPVGSPTEVDATDGSTKTVRMAFPSDRDPKVSDMTGSPLGVPITVIIQNTGTGTLTVTAISSSDTTYWFPEGGTGTITSGSSQSFTLRLIMMEVDSTSTTLTITNDDPTGDESTYTIQFDANVTSG